MRFDLFRRHDLVMVLVPTAVPQPCRLARDGPLVAIGAATMNFSAISADLARSIACQGYGVANLTDESLIYGSLVRHR